MLNRPQLTVFLGAGSQDTKKEPGQPNSQALNPNPINYHANSDTDAADPFNLQSVRSVVIKSFGVYGNTTLEVGESFQRICRCRR